MTLGHAVALAAERITAPVEGMHRRISARWFATIGPASRPVQSAHDAVAGVVYGSIRLGANAIGVGLDAGVTLETRTADAVQAFVNGLWGDALGRRAGRLQTSMSLRDARGRRIPLDDGLSAAFPAATDRLVVLVHGLIKTERCWHDTDTAQGVLGRLEDDPALTPVAIRYNTGLSVEANGRHLASLLDEVHAGWPVPVRSITLIGHSMGGLVARSACAHARHNGYRWIDDVDDIVAIASPHRGAPLEKFVHAAARGLDVAPETRPLADFLNTRSAGIKDLRFGVVDDEASTNPGTEASPRHHFVAGVITADPAHPFGAVVGDLMVRPASSTSAPRLEPTNVAVLGGVNHFDLLHDPDVIDTVLGWLSDAR